MLAARDLHVRRQRPWLQRSSRCATTLARRVGLVPGFPLLHGFLAAGGTQRAEVCAAACRVVHFSRAHRAVQHEVGLIQHAVGTSAACRRERVLELRPDAVVADEALVTAVGQLHLDLDLGGGGGLQAGLLATAVHGRGLPGSRVTLCYTG